MLVRMTSALFEHARMSGVVIPGFGETVDLSTEDAESLVAAKHAEAVEDDTEASEPEVAPEPDPAPVETAEAPAAPEVAAEPEKRAPGRPRKRAE